MMKVSHLPGSAEREDVVANEDQGGDCRPDDKPGHRVGPAAPPEALGQKVKCQHGRGRANLKFGDRGVSRQKSGCHESAGSSAATSLGEQVKRGGKSECGELVTVGERRVNVSRCGQSVGQAHECSAAW